MYIFHLYFAFLEQHYIAFYKTCTILVLNRTYLHFSKVAYFMTPFLSTKGIYGCSNTYIYLFAVETVLSRISYHISEVDKAVSKASLILLQYKDFSQTAFLVTSRR